MRSMTGFGSAEKYSEELQYGFKVELASINKKQFDLKISMGRELARYETELRAFIAGRVTRGSLTLRIETVVHADSGVQKVDFTKAEALLAAAREFQKKHDLPGEITISDILAIPEAAVVQAADLSGEECLNFLESTVAEAVDELIRMRTREGENLKRDILERIDVMETLVDEIRPLAAQLPAIQKERLFKRLKEFDLSIEDTDERILREAVIYGDKLDVTEEITRLRSHFTNFRKLANEPENPVGRSLDFMVQEIFRECNTLGNKAGSTEISPRVVMLKTELEKIREQVQNIE
ncbi:MAG: YicC family protein [bacterium]|nr:YicC family protein [bacterium]